MTAVSPTPERETMVRSRTNFNRGASMQPTTHQEDNRTTIPLHVQYGFAERLILRPRPDLRNSSVEHIAHELHKTYQTVQSMSERNRFVEGWRIVRFVPSPRRNVLVKCEHQEGRHAQFFLHVDDIIKGAPNTVVS